MNAGKYLFRFVVAVTAFFIGISTFAGTTYLLSYFGPKKTTYISSVPLAIPVTADPNINIEYGVSGEYYLFDQALNRGLPDIDHIGIRAEDEHGYSIPPRGYVRTKRDYKFISISVTVDLISFETERVHGVSYVFSGGFERSADDDGENIKVLRGSPEKLEKGKTVATINSSFYPSRRFGK